VVHDGAFDKKGGMRGFRSFADDFTPALTAPVIFKTIDQFILSVLPALQLFLDAHHPPGSYKQFNN
jgi:hypothetical protein